MKSVYLLCLLTFFIACNSEAINDDILDPKDIKQFTDSGYNFAWQIYESELSLSTKKNVLISPLSIHTAFAMASNGAKDNTQKEIFNVLKCENCDIPFINKLYQTSSIILTQKDKNPEVTISNSFFSDSKRLKVHEDFRNNLISYYGTHFQEEIFSNPTNAMKNINSWVAKSTKNKIDKIVEKIESQDIAFLINAIYFKADWANGFIAESTNEGIFTDADGKKINVKYMNGDSKYLNATVSNFTMVDLPFKDSTYSLSLAMPNSSTNAKLSKEIYDELLKNLKSGRINLTIPKMKLNYKTSLIPALKKLGMSLPFDEQQANFTALGTAGNNIFISQVEHKSVLEIDEKGAEGAAVTSIGFSATSLPPAIKFDRPFTIVLRHIETQSIVFIGWVGYQML